MSFAHLQHLRNSFPFLSRQAHLQIISKRRPEMHKSQIGGVNVSYGIFNVVGGRIGAFWRATLDRRTQPMSGLSAKLRYDIGEDDVRPEKGHDRGETSFEVMLRRSI